MDRNPGRPRSEEILVRLGISSAMFFSESIYSVVARAQNLKVDSIEWSSNAHIPPGDFETAERAMLSTLRAGLTISSYATSYRVGVDDEGFARFLTALDTARRVEAPIMRVYCGLKPLDSCSDDERESLVSEMRTLGDIAGKKGVTLACGLHPKTALGTYAGASDILEETGHPFVQMYWEPLDGNDFDATMSGLSLSDGLVAIMYARSSEPKRGFVPLASRVDDWIFYLDALARERCREMTRFVVLNTPENFHSIEDDIHAIRKWLPSLPKLQ